MPHTGHQVQRGAAPVGVGGPASAQLPHVPPTACPVIDSERCLTPNQALPLRCRLASVKMRSGHLLCMGSPGWCTVCPLTTTRPR